MDKIEFTFIILEFIAISIQIYLQLKSDKETKKIIQEMEEIKCQK